MAVVEIKFETFVFSAYFFTNRKLSRTYKTFDDWYKANLARAKIASSVIGYECPTILRFQEIDLMNYRKKVCPTIGDWFKVSSKISEHSQAIDAICRDYAVKKMCHREFRGSGAGIWCYCDEHLHKQA